MSKKEKPLPKPPTTAFGRKKQFEHEEEQGSFLADRMAAAVAEGRLEEFLKEEMPDNEYARNLATMMMGMTGMMPAGEPSQPPKQQTSENAPPAETPSQTIPEDVERAVQGGDVKGLMDLLRREHQKRMPGAGAKPEEEAASSQPAEQPLIEKELIDALIRIASDNSVSLDWIMLRAIKVYVEEYKKTGKL